MIQRAGKAAAIPFRVHVQTLPANRRSYRLPHYSASGARASSAMICSRRVNTTRPIATMFILAIVSRMTAKASCQNRGDVPTQAWLSFTPIQIAH
jgi:hypothetical protein